jgi:hypothetical protein
VDWIGSGQGPVAGCCECGDEPSGSCATELVSMLLLVIRISSDYFLKPIDLCNGEVLCSPCNKNWIVVYYLDGL